MAITERNETVMPANDTPMAVPQPPEMAASAATTSRAQSAPGSAAPAKSSERLHLSFLDGARGFAALWVLLNHNIDSGKLASYVSVPAVSAAIRFLGGWINLGHFAVDLFIVLSGFCLMLPIARKGFVQKDGALAFYRKRAHRILPPYYFNILVMSAWLVLVGRFGNHTDAVPSPKVYLINILLLEDIVPHMLTINPVFWSIAVEWRIYFLLPLFVKIWRSAGPVVLFLVSGLIAAIGTVAVVTIYPAVNIPRWCPWYVILFTFGLIASGLLFGGGEKSVLVAAESRKRCLSLVAPLTVVVGCVAIASYNLLHPDLYKEGSGWASFDWPSPVVDILIGAFATLSLALLTLWNANGQKNLLTRFFDAPLLVQAGVMGYSLYLTHPLAGMIIEAVANRLRKAPGLGEELGFAAVSIVLSLLLSAAYYRIVESRFLNSPVGGEVGVKAFLFGRRPTAVR